MNGSEDENLVSDNGVDKEFKVGMTVYSEEEAYNLCNAYATKKGFSIRKGNRRTDKLGNLRQRDFLCSKEGFYRNGEPHEVKQVKKLDIRTGCNARFRFTIENGVWKLTFLDDEHNHELATPEERQFLRSGRKILDAYGGILMSMVGAGIRPTKSFSFLSEEVGGAANVESIKKDFQKKMQRKKDEAISGGDGQSKKDEVIPDHYILKRRTKKAKKGIVVSGFGESSSTNGKSAQSLRLSDLMHEGINVFSIGSMTERGTKIVREKLAEALEIIENDVETMDMLGTFNKEGDQCVGVNSTNEPPILNPPRVRAKGIPNTRIESNLKKRKKKASKVSSSIVGPPHPSSLPFGVPPGPNLCHQVTPQGVPNGHPNFSFTGMLQDNVQMPYLNQGSSTSLNANHAFGQFRRLSQASYLHGSDHFQQEREQQE